MLVITLSVCAWAEYSKMCTLLVKDTEIFQCLRVFVFVFFIYFHIISNPFEQKEVQR